MKQEDHASSELVMLLFEKGYTKYPMSYDGDYWFCYIQMAMRWLREIHNIHIEIFVIKNYDKKICEYTYTIMDLNFPGSDDGIDCCNNYKTYDQASEAAVKYCAERLVW